MQAGCTFQARWSWRVAAGGRASLRDGPQDIGAGPPAGAKHGTARARHTGAVPRTWPVPRKVFLRWNRPFSLAFTSSMPPPPARPGPAPRRGVLVGCPLPAAPRRARGGARAPSSNGGRPAPWWRASPRLLLVARSIVVLTDPPPYPRTPNACSTGPEGTRDR